MKKLIALKVGSIILAVGTVITLWWSASPVYTGSNVDYTPVVKGLTIFACVLYTFGASMFAWRANEIKSV